MTHSTRGTLERILWPTLTLMSMLGTAGCDRLSDVIDEEEVREPDAARPPPCDPAEIEGRSPVDGPCFDSTSYSVEGHIDHLSIGLRELRNPSDRPVSILGVRVEGAPSFRLVYGEALGASEELPLRLEPGETTDIVIGFETATDEEQEAVLIVEGSTDGDAEGIEEVRLRLGGRAYPASEGPLPDRCREHACLELWGSLRPVAAFWVPSWNVTYVLNLGVEPLTISRVALEGHEAFELIHVDAEGMPVVVDAADPLVLEPGAIADVIWRFTPSEGDDFEAELVVESDDPEVPTTRVSISGSHER